MLWPRPLYWKLLTGSAVTQFLATPPQFKSTGGCCCHSMPWPRPHNLNLWADVAVTQCLGHAHSLGSYGRALLSLNLLATPTPLEAMNVRCCHSMRWPRPSRCPLPFIFHYLIKPRPFRPRPGRLPLSGHAQGGSRVPFPFPAPPPQWPRPFPRSGPGLVPGLGPEPAPLPQVPNPPRTFPNLPEPPRTFPNPPEPPRAAP